MCASSAIERNSIRREREYLSGGTRRVAETRKPHSPAKWQEKHGHLQVSAREEKLSRQHEPWLRPVRVLLLDATVVQPGSQCSREQPPRCGALSRNPFADECLFGPDKGTSGVPESTEEVGVFSAGQSVSGIEGPSESLDGRFANEGVVCAPFQQGRSL